MLYDTTFNGVNQQAVHGNLMLVSQVLEAYVQRTRVFRERTTTLNWYILDFIAFLMGERDVKTQPGFRVESRHWRQGYPRYLASQNSSFRRFIKQAFPPEHRIWEMLENEH